MEHLPLIIVGLVLFVMTVIAEIRKRNLKGITNRYLDSQKKLKYAEAKIKDTESVYSGSIKAAENLHDKYEDALFQLSKTYNQFTQLRECYNSLCEGIDLKPKFRFQIDPKLTEETEKMIEEAYNKFKEKK